MAQLTIYIDDETLARIELSARKEKDSVSHWVKKHLVRSIEESWPHGYFDVFGSLRAVGIKRPAQPDTGKDRKRAAV